MYLLHIWGKFVHSVYTVNFTVISVVSVIWKSHKEVQSFFYFCEMNQEAIQSVRISNKVLKISTFFSIPLIIFELCALSPFWLLKGLKSPKSFQTLYRDLFRFLNFRIFRNPINSKKVLFTKKIFFKKDFSLWNC